MLKRLKGILYRIYMNLKMFAKRLLWNIQFSFFTFKNRLLNKLNRGGGQIKCIVSLTSFPARIKYVKYTLYSLLSQTYTPQKIVLWLAIEQFPDRKLPKCLIRLQEVYAERFEILWCSDLKSYKKLIPTLSRFPDLPIVTADDDAYYHSEWLERLWKSYMDSPNCIHGHMTSKISLESYLKWEEIKTSHKLSLQYISIGVGGILYPPNCFHQDILDVQNFKKLAPLADDLYFWAMAVLNGTKTKLVNSFLGHPIHTTNYWDSPNLYTKNCYEGLNDVQFANILKKYPQIREKIKAQDNLRDFQGA